MEIFSPLWAFVNVFEGFQFGHCNISVSLVEYFSQGFGFLTTRQYLKISRFLKGEGEIVNMDFWSSLSICIAASCCWFNHTKLGIYFKGIVQWYSISTDISYHYHVYSVSILIYCIFADVDIVTSCNKCLNDYQTSLPSIPHPVQCLHFVRVLANELLGYG